MHTATILTGGTIHTIDRERGAATALAIAGNHILAVGDDATIAALAGPATRRVDLAGRTLVPGFNDAHIHLWKGCDGHDNSADRPACCPSSALARPLGQVRYS